MRIAVVGSGAMGSLFAARLAPLAEVTMIAHWAPQLAALRQRGLTLEEPDGRRAQLQPGTLEVTSEPAAVVPVDVALILVKSYQIARAAGEAAMLLAPDGIVLTLQNGLGNREILGAAVGPERALAGTTSEGATLLEPGIVRHAGRGLTYLGANQAQSARAATLATLLEEAGFATRLESNVEALLWAKVAVNAGINPLTALLGTENGFLLQHEPARELMIAAAEEAAAVAAALGCHLPLPPAGERVVQVARATAANSSSMLQDLRNRRQTEIEAITGAVVTTGATHGIATPVNDALLSLVRAAEQGEPWRPRVSLLADKRVRSSFAELAALSTPA
jgi:2-dehydropantoate 2-reductase